LEPAALFIQVANVASDVDRKDQHIAFASGRKQFVKRMPPVVVATIGDYDHGPS
jgi:hypothetical protein